MTIRLNGVSVFVRNEISERALLNHIDTSFEQGQCTLVIGQTGSGKSTLLQTVAGLIPPGQGRISYGGIPLWTKRGRIHDELKPMVGISFQYPERQLFAENVRQELAYSLRPLGWTKQDKLRVMHEALDRLNLPRKMLDEPVMTLSEGTKRKIALAATFVTKPRWLLLDEPTAGIDPSGVQPLLHSLRFHLAHGGGLIVASHDLDTFLPIADRVLIVQNGTIEADIMPQELCESPDLLLQAGVGWPGQVQLAAALHACGIGIAAVPLTPEAAASAIIERLERGEAASHIISSSCSMDQPWPVPTVQASIGHITAGEASGNKERTSIAERLDPIAKWIFYISVSTGILVQQHGLGLLLASLLTIVLVAASRVSMRTVAKGGVKFFLIFIVVSSIISGLQINFDPFKVGFQTNPALDTAKQLLRFLLVMMLGIVFMATTNEQRMLRGLERALSGLEKYHIPTKLITFSTALMLRFIPMLNQEADRLSLIAKARGKADVKRGTIRLRDVHVFLIPLLLSMMKHAEDIAFALEARGYKERSHAHVTGSAFCFRKHDWRMIAFGLMLLFLFLAIHILLN